MPIDGTELTGFGVRLHGAGQNWIVSPLRRDASIRLKPVRNCADRLGPLNLRQSVTKPAWPESSVFRTLYRSQH